MKTEIYSISELEDYIRSEQYASASSLPVSPERAASYISNPRAGKNMPVLFMLKENEELLAYRTLLPDRLNTGGKDVCFAWLSGNYVHPDHRRKGLSTKLYKEVEAAWEGKLLYTNYAPASKAVYDKTTAFECFAERPGRRYYMRSSLATLYQERVKARGLLKFADMLINGIHDFQLIDGSYSITEGIKISEIDHIDEKLAELIQNRHTESKFGRGPVEFEWIRKYPWLSEKPVSHEYATYQFSRKVQVFKTKWYRLESETGLAFLWISHVNKKTSVPYFFNNNKALLLAARQLVLNEMLLNKSSHLTIHHPELGPVLGTRKNPFLLSRNMPQRYFAHKKLIPFISNNKVIHDGDGDCVFT